MSAPPASVQPPSVTLRDYYRQPDAAWYLGVSARTLIRLTNCGAVACAKVGKKLTLYRRADLDSFFQRNRRKAVGEARP